MGESLKPIFDFADCDSSVVLHEGNVEIVSDGRTYTGTGRAQLDFRPTPHVHYYADFEAVQGPVAVMALFDLETIDSFKIDGHEIEGFAISVGGSQPDKTMSIKWCPCSTPIDGIGNGSDIIAHVCFHLFNFTDYISRKNTGVQIDGNQHQLISYIDLIDDKWNVRISSQFETSQRIKTLRADGGYQLTHVALVRAIDGSGFHAANVEDLLLMLRYFLSFSKGCWCEPNCPVGFDLSGNRKWSLWSSPREPWKTVASWFPEHSPESLEQLFPHFSRIWKKEGWMQALSEVIYWYLGANSSGRGIDVGIILAQAALERLSYEFAVRDRKLMLTKGFKDLWASDKFRLLFSSLNIPIEIPADCAALRSLAGQNNWVDAPHALTEVRNSLVHPEHKRRGHFDDVMYEVWNLGLWYLEMSILAVCGYTGLYANRLKKRWKGQYEAVPWGVQETKQVSDEETGI